MPLSVDGQNALLTSGLGNLAGFGSLHATNPGLTGVGELAGGSPAYARKAVTWNAASGGQRTNNGAITFDVEGGDAYSYIGLWSLITAGVFYGWVPNGGFAAQMTTAADTGDVFTSFAHGYTNGQEVVLANYLAEAMPGGFTEGDRYFIIASATNTFQLSLTSGGSAVAATSNAECWVQRILTETFGAQGTAVIADTQLVLDGRLM